MAPRSDRSHLGSWLGLLGDEQGSLAREEVPVGTQDPPILSLAFVLPLARNVLLDRPTDHVRAVSPLRAAQAAARRLGKAIEGSQARLINRNRNSFHISYMIAERDP